MSEYWVSQGRKMCSYCKCWIADNKASINFHEQGKKHKEMVVLKLDELRKKGLQDARNRTAEAAAMAAIEKAALESFQKDVGAGSAKAYGSVPVTEKQVTAKEEPTKLAKTEYISSRAKKQESKGQWEQATNEEGYTYYWNTETHETSWTLPNSSESTDTTSESQPQTTVQPSIPKKPVKRSATTGFGQWETVREEPVVYDDLGLPNQPAYEGEETDEHITEQQSDEEINTEDIPLPTEDIPLPSDISEAKLPDEAELVTDPEVPERKGFKTKTVTLAPSKKNMTGDGAPKFKKPKFNANRKSRRKDDD